MLPSSLAPSLQMAADIAITKVFTHDGIRKWTKKPNDEVSAVGTMTLDGFDEISKAWSPILETHGLRIDLEAVFCHSRPRVTFDPVPHPEYKKLLNDPRCCELADLLIVIDHVVDPSRNINDRRAVLVQAKKVGKDGVFKLKDKEWIQHELLGWLPPFTFQEKLPRGYDSRRRNLKGASCVGSHLHTAEYGVIDFTSPQIWCHWLTDTVAPWFNREVSFAQYLAGMATGDSNFSRKAVIGGDDDWSFTVDELLRVTRKRGMKYKSMFKPGKLRGNLNVIGYIVDTASWPYIGGGGGDGDVEDETPEWPDGPISTVKITVGPDARESGGD